MTLKAEITDDLAVFFDTDAFADSATYQAVGSGETTITVIVDREGGLAEGANGAVESEFARLQVYAQKTEIATPKSGDKLTWNGRVYNFHAIADEDSDTWLLEFIWSEVRYEGRRRESPA